MFKRDHRLLPEGETFFPKSSMMIFSREIIIIEFYINTFRKGNQYLLYFNIFILPTCLSNKHQTLKENNRDH